MAYVAVPLKISFRSFCLEADHSGFVFAITQTTKLPDVEPLLKIDVLLPYSATHIYQYKFDDLFLSKGVDHFVWIQHVYLKNKSVWKKGPLIPFMLDGLGNVIGDILGGGSPGDTYGQIDDVFGSVVYEMPATVSIIVE
jgi:hypothetical protein